MTVDDGGCWFYVRVFSGTPGTNAPGDKQSPPLSDSDAKFGITRRIAARESVYRGDGGITAFCVQFPTAEVAHAVEWLLVDRFKPMRSQAIGGGHREYLDLRKVAATFGQTFAAGSAQSRLDIARLVMRCALIVLKTNRPDASITDTSLHAWADEGSESAILKPSDKRPGPVVHPRLRRALDFLACERETQCRYTLANV